jgi:hypothetical protein
MMNADCRGSFIAASPGVFHRAINCTPLERSAADIGSHKFVEACAFLN